MAKGFSPSVEGILLGVLTGSLHCPFTMRSAGEADFHAARRMRGCFENSCRKRATSGSESVSASGSIIWIPKGRFRYRFRSRPRPRKEHETRIAFSCARVRHRPMDCCSENNSIDGLKPCATDRARALAHEGGYVHIGSEIRVRCRLRRRTFGAASPDAVCVVPDPGCRSSMPLIA